VPAQEEHEAVPLPLVTCEDVAVPEAVLHLDDQRVDLGPQRAVGGAAEAALDAR
jgi:hypothetical protein